MISTVLLVLGGLFVAKHFVKANALEVKAENKAIESTFNALLERQEFAKEAQAQNPEIYQAAVKLAKK